MIQSWMTASILHIYPELLFEICCVITKYFTAFSKDLLPIFTKNIITLEGKKFYCFISELPIKIILFTGWTLAAEYPILAFSEPVTNAWFLNNLLDCLFMYHGLQMRQTCTATRTSISCLLSCQYWCSKRRHNTWYNKQLCFLSLNDWMLKSSSQHSSIATCFTTVTSVAKTQSSCKRMFRRSVL